MATLLSVFVLGLSLGLILFLLAAGMTLTMGLMRIVNMAHGALYMVGGYVGIAVGNYTHNFWLAMLAGAAVAGLIGIALEMGFLRRLYNDEASQVLLTIGFIYILQNLTQWIWGTYPMGGPIPELLSKAVPVGSIELPAYRFFLIGFGLFMAFLLWRFQDKTKVGSWVRAGMDNREITGTFGINLKLLFTGIFALGSLIAGMCGVLGAPMTGMNLGIGWGALLLALIVVVIGGTGSIQGALLGGLIIGLLNAFGGAYFPAYADYVVYLALIVILLARPAGLLGRKHDTRTGENLEKASTAKGGASPFAPTSADHAAAAQMAADGVPLRAVSVRPGGAAGAAPVRQHLLPGHAHQGPHLRHLRHEPRPGHGLHGPHLLRLGGVLRDLRLLGGDPHDALRRDVLLGRAPAVAADHGGAGRRHRLSEPQGVRHLLPARDDGVRPASRDRGHQVVLVHGRSRRPVRHPRPRPRVHHDRLDEPELLLLRR